LEVILLSNGKDTRLSQRQKKILVFLKKLDELDTEFEAQNKTIRSWNTWRFRWCESMQKCIEEPIIRDYASIDWGRRTFNFFNINSFRRSIRNLYEKEYVKRRGVRPFSYYLTEKGLEAARRIENEARDNIDEWNKILNFSPK
jgi:hypothetical protein